jgi:hypothetical protein
METPKEILTEEDKIFINENYAKMSVMQMAIRRNIKTENRKCPIIADYIKAAGLKTKTTEVVIDAKPPEPSVNEKMEQIVSQDVPVESDADSEPYKEVDDTSILAFANELKSLHIKVREPLSDREKMDIRFLMHQMQSTRFLQIYKSYGKKDCKILFKEEFIRAMFGKGEMPQEEVNDFIDMCSELTRQHVLRCQIKDLEKMLDDKDFPKEKRVGVIEVIKELNREITDSTKRVSEIKEGLGTLREQRIKDTRNTGLTLSSMLESFYDSEKREKLVRLQDRKNKELMDALEKIDALEETKALIMGISKEELQSGAN